MNPALLPCGRAGLAVECVVAGRAKKVMVMLAVLGLVPNAAPNPSTDSSVPSSTPRWRARYTVARPTPVPLRCSTVPWRTGAVRLAKGSQDGHLLLRSLHELHGNRFLVIIKTCSQHGSLVPEPRPERGEPSGPAGPNTRASPPTARVCRAPASSTVWMGDSWAMRWIVRCETPNTSEDKC